MTTTTGTAQYHAQPTTPREHCDNCAFQLANVQGWLGADDLAVARIKAECLLSATRELIFALESQLHPQP